MSRHAWCEKNTYELIRLYEENAPLWDTKHADYRNREVKVKLISNIATRMNVTMEEINRKLHNLRNQVSQELNKLKKKKRSNGDETSTSSWPYFSALKFLIPSVINRSRSSNAKIQRMIFEGEECDRGNAELDKVEDETKRKHEERREKKRPVKSLDVSDDEEVKRPRASTRVSDEDDRFGEWIALELRGLRSEVNKRKLKSEIRRAICRIVDLDDAGISVPNTSSNPSPPHSPSSPIYIPICEITNIKSENI